MIVSCPSCHARYRLDRNKLNDKRVTLRCAKCRQVFKIATGNQDNGKVSPARSFPFRVLVAHGDALLCAAVGEILKQGQISYDVVNDGNVALEMVQNKVPDVVLIDVALPGLFAFELVQKIRENVRLEKITLILLSSVYNKMAYKRRPDNLYGADGYIEKHHLSDDLVPMLNRIQLGVTQAHMKRPAELQVEGTVAVENQDIPAYNDIGAMNQRIQSAEEHELATDIPDQDIARARRLARIIVSDIALYNQSRVEEGIRNGSFMEIFAEELAEGRRLFAERISKDVQGREDFFETEIKRFLKQRILDMQGNKDR
ncbi:MAG: zinc-ribbon domain-containing protein [Desulfuromonadaceae bacterium]|nr:zinc-ribbon domain-containing protein [Desulfuromonadaceae bacterium]